MNRKVVSLSVALGLILTINTTVFADPSLDSQLQNQKSQLQQNQDALKKTQDKMTELEASIEKLDNDIQNTMIQRDNINAQIKTTQTAIDAAKADIQKTENELIAEQNLYDKRMNTMYKKGSDGYLSVLLDSTSVTDFISRVEYIKKIAEFDNQLLADFKAKEDELKKKKDALDAENVRLQGLKSDYDQKVDKLNQDKQTQSSMVADLQSQEKDYNSKINQNKSDIDATNKKIQEAVAAEAAREAEARAKASSGVNTSVLSRGDSAAYNGNTITSIAFNVAYDAQGNCRNIPYVWGGNGPNSFDCSGFVVYVFAQAGLHPFNGERTTYGMINQGRTVSRDQLQPGDVIYFGTYSNPHHVAIYMGNGMIIHAPHTGDVVRMASLSGFSDYLVAKRMN